MKIVSRTTVFLLLFAIFGYIAWTYSDQLKIKTSRSTQKTNEPTITTSIFFSEKLTLANKIFESQLIKHSVSGQNTYWQLVKSKNPSLGTIIFSIPYAGVDWTAEEIDLRWSAHPSALAGITSTDNDGPLYDPVTSKNIFYQLIKKEELPKTGLGLSLNGYDVLYVYHRFYAGRYINDYINDLIEAVAWVKNKNPQSEIGLYGLSLGGFIAAQAASVIHSKNLKAVVLASPLLSWPQQNIYLNSLETLISDPEKRNHTLDFFEPYKRRFSNDESKNLDVPQFSTPSLVFHDEWDTLVPISQSDRLKEKNSSNVILFKFLHANPIDLVNMSSGHFQPGSGQSADNIIPFYLAYFFNHVATDQNTKQIFYSQNSMDNLFNEMFASHTAAKNISGFQQALKELCKNNFLMIETTNLVSEKENAPQYLARKLKTVWGLTETDSTICQYLETKSL